MLPCFRVEPLKRNWSRLKLLSDISPSLPSERTYSILVVEDYPEDVYVIQQAFRECGYRCELTIADSHAEAKIFLATKHFDLALSDFGTDFEQARSFVTFVRASAPCLPIVVLSGGHNPNLAYKAGANAFLQKPPNLKEFLEKIRGLMHFWIEIALLPQYPESRSTRNAKC